jgi:hypothetical protein
MRIEDNNNLIKDKRLLHKIIREHPFNKELHHTLNIIIIEESSQEGIEFNSHNKDVTLYLPKDCFSKNNFEHIIYHEFTHVTDKLDPSFMYSEDKKNGLSPKEKTQVMELWNLFIDDRLNDIGLFQIGDVGFGYSKINGRLTYLPCTLEGKLTKHTRVLQSSGIRNARDIVESIWNNPRQFLSYDDIISIIKN